MAVLKAKGKLSVNEKKKRIVLDISLDFVKLYLWFIKKKFWYELGAPAHGAHITLTNPKVHSNVDFKKALKHHGKEFEFEYDENMVRGGYTKGFVMFYMRVFSKELEDLKKDLGIVESNNYKGLHVTIGNGKNTNLRPYWPNLITITK